MAQADYRKGYVLTGARDTLVGLVNYREGVKAFASCDFKRAADQEVVTYEPGRIVGYGFEGDKFFQSREVVVKGEPPKTVFLEVVVRGSMSLYKFEGIYFVEKEGGGLQQLTNETKVVYVDGKKLLKNTNQHAATLGALVFDCAEVRDKARVAKLNEKSLTKLLEDYNQCKGMPSTTFEAKRPWTKISVGLSAGVNVSYLDFAPNPNYAHLSGDFEVAKSPIGGLSINFLSPRVSERISFQSDVLYTASNYYSYSQFRGSSSIVTNYITIGIQQLKIPMGISYTFPMRKIAPYFNVGVSSTIHLNSHSKWTQEIQSSVVTINEGEALVVRQAQFGVWVGSGFLKTINRRLNAFVEMRYEQTDGIAPFTVDAQGVFSNINNLQIMFGIRTK